MRLLKEVSIPILAALVAVFTMTVSAWGQHEVVSAQWVIGPLDFSKNAGIRNNRIELGAADAEIEPLEGNAFLHMRIRFAQLDENARTDLVATSYLQDANGQQPKPMAVLDEKVWRPVGFLRTALTR